MWKSIRLLEETSISFYQVVASTTKSFENLKAAIPCIVKSYNLTDRYSRQQTSTNKKPKRGFYIDFTIEGSGLNLFSYRNPYRVFVVINIGNYITWLYTESDTTPSRTLFLSINLLNFTTHLLYN
jgi:hypothetical protein